jgi:hypothetical protein
MKLRILYLLPVVLAVASTLFGGEVKCVRAPMPLKTYPVGAPEKNPMFFEKRVYQGSCGKVYPVPFIDKVYDTPSMKDYDAVTLENEYVRLVLLPELGGRIYIGQDKFIHSPRPRAKVRIESLSIDYWKKYFVTARRVARR